MTSLYCDILQNELVPFQLFYENGKPWVTVYFYGALKESKIHRMIFFVSILLNLYSVAFFLLFRHKK